MTGTGASACTREAAVSTVTVAVVGLPGIRPEGLAEAASGLAVDPGTTWLVRRDADVTAGDCIDIVLCDSAAAVRSARVRWPAANILTLVAPYGSEGAVVAALDAGAHVCVRDSDPAVIAAYLHSIARRRRLGV